jgi:hypothetical protein
MKEYRQAAEEEAAAMKDSYVVLKRLYSLFRKFNSEERIIANEVLAEWVLSDDEGLRFDAMALIHEFRIATTAPTLQKLMKRLEGSKAPSAPFEIEKIERLLTNLDDRRV